MPSKTKSKVGAQVVPSYPKTNKKRKPRHHKPSKMDLVIEEVSAASDRRDKQLERELIKRLIEVHKVQTISYQTTRMVKFIQSEVNRMRQQDTQSLYQVDVHQGNVYVTKSASLLPSDDMYYPCVVAHTDTVHEIYHGFDIMQTGDRLIAYDHDLSSQVGIGGDDKVGIFVALEALRRFPNIKAAFFRDEEVGCVGSSLAKQDFFENTGYAIQCDRQKYKDVVRAIYGGPLFDNNFSEAISPILEKYGREETYHGGITDVGELSESFYKMCCMNLSCGYYEPHSSQEYLRVSEVLATLDFVFEVIETLGETPWFNPDRELGYQHTSRSWGETPYDKDYLYEDEYAYYKEDRLGEPSNLETMSYNGDVYDHLGRLIIDVRDFDTVDEIYEAQFGLECPHCGCNDLMYDEDEDAEFCAECNNYVITYHGYPEGVNNILDYVSLQHAIGHTNKEIDY